MKALRSSLYYFENLVDDNDDPTRKATNEQVKSKLRTIITETEANIQCKSTLDHVFWKILSHTLDLDTRIKDLATEIDNLFNTPDFQKHPVSIP